MLKISSLKKLVTDSMAIDLGTASTIIAVKEFNAEDGDEAGMSGEAVREENRLHEREWQEVVATDEALGLGGCMVGPDYAEPEEALAMGIGSETA